MADDSSINRSETMDFSKLSAVTVTIDGVTVDCYIDADQECEAVMVGDVNIGPLLETATSGNKAFWDYLDTVIARELHMQRQQREEDRACDILADRELDKLCY
jgi:hypothetical protein